MYVPVNGFRNFSSSKGVEVTSTVGRKLKLELVGQELPGKIVLKNLINS